MVIPCYNEEPALAGVLDLIPRFVDEIIVVDNNSTDYTSTVAVTRRATVLVETRQGYGFSIDTGLKNAQGDLLVVIDGDGTYPIQDLEQLLSVMREDGLDFLSASRFPLADRQAMKLYSKAGNFILTVVTRILFGFTLRDSQSGMWVVSRSAYKKMNLTAGGMGYSEEIKIKALGHKSIAFGEMPINYQKRIGEVKLKAFSDGVKNLWLLVKLRFF